MSAECQLESIHRIHLLRTELEQSLLRANGGGGDSITQRSGEKRPLNVIFRSGDAAQIQISGHPRAVSAANNSDLTSAAGVRSIAAPRHQIAVPSSPTSRFTVSPTPNAIPAMTDERKQRANGEVSKPRPLHVLITRQGEEEENGASTLMKSITVPSANLVTASSPASSIDSGVGGEVASPGAIANNNTGGNEFHLFGGPSSPSGFPSWATIPRAKRRIFNFFNTEWSPVIDALALPTSKADLASSNAAQLKLQEPPSGKNIQYGSSSSTPFQQWEHQQQQNKNNEENGYSSSSASTFSSPISPPSSTNVPHFAVQQQQPQPVNNSKELKLSFPQRQFSIDSKKQEIRSEEKPLNGLPPRASTMPPLKSILKKPKTAPADGSQQQAELPRNHQRRMPTRIFLSRSISEGLPPPSSPSSFFEHIADFNAAILGELTSSSPPSSHLDVFDEHLEEQCGEELFAAQPKGNSSPSTCSTDTNESGEAGSIVKKRVSFSEHVQARIYRSNSSILGQRRKNEKKAKQRTNRRSNSDEFEGSGCEMEFGNEPGCKSSSLPVCRHRESPSAFSSHPANNSGFSVLAQ